MAETTGAPPPPRERLRQGKTIAVGSVEKLPNGRVLRCTAQGRTAEVTVTVNDKLDTTLSFQAQAPLNEGDLIDEGEFTRVLDAYYIHSPWHDGEYTCSVLTIDCLRMGREPELLTFKDM